MQCLDLPDLNQSGPQLCSHHPVMQYLDLPDLNQAGPQLCSHHPIMQCLALPDLVQLAPNFARIILSCTATACAVPCNK